MPNNVLDLTFGDNVEENERRPNVFEAFEVA